MRAPAPDEATAADRAEEKVRQLVAEQKDRDDMARWLLALGDEAFREIAGKDANERLDRDAWAALRHPAVLKRWRAMLLHLRVDGKTQVAEKEADPGFADWYRKYARWDERLRARILEVDHLVAEQVRAKGKNWARTAFADAGEREQAARQATGEDPADDGISRKTRRMIAGDIAVARLVEAHRDEFKAIFDEELEVLSTPVEVRERTGLLVRAGLTARAAEEFALKSWPAGEITEGVWLEVRE